MLMIEGGASCPPSLNKFPLFAIENCKRLWNFDTPKTTADKNVKNIIFLRLEFEGFNKFLPSLSINEMFVCFPLPFIPAKGFSWNNNLNSCFRASFLIVSIKI